MSDTDLHILLVEDNPGDADLLREALSPLDAPLEITHVERLAQATECLKQGGRVDAILLDLGLPDSTGVATLERANLAAPHLPIIVLTGLEDEAMGIEAVRKGAQDYLVKGQTPPRMLVRSIHHAIERKQIREALLQSEERYRLAIQATKDAIWDVNIATGVANWNETYSTAFGGPRETSGFRQWWTDRIHPEDRSRVSEGLRAAIDGGNNVWICEYRFLRADGTWANIYDRALIARDKSGTAWRIVGAMQDITERKQSEEALEAARIEAVNDKSRLEAVMETLPVGVAIVDAKGANVRSNKTFEEVWGSPRPPASTISDYAKYRARWIDTNEPVRPEQWASARAVRKGETVVGQLMQIERFDGRLAFVVNSAAPIFAANGEIVGGVVAILDVTDRIEAEQALKELNETLEQRVAERTALAERRAHLLTRLAAELSRVEHGERRRLAAILHEDLQQLLLAARLRLAGLGDGDEPRVRAEVEAVDALLGECMGASRDLTVELSPPVLHRGALGEVFEWLGDWFGEKHGLKVTVDAQEGLPSAPEHIQVFLFHAVRELLLNTVKHSGRKNARVRLSAENGCLTVQVEDRGSGFDPEVVRQKLDRAHSFGLLNIRERLEALEGRLEFESAPAGGARFRLIVPVTAVTQPLGEPVPSASGAVDRAAAQEPRSEAGTIRLLVVDDHRVVREGFVGLLNREPDFAVVGEATDGEEAIRQAEALKPDVIIMDVEMPNTDGIEATRQIRQRQPDALIIGLSFHEEESVVRAMREAGAFAHLSKNGPAETLIEAIRRACGRA